MTMSTEAVPAGGRETRPAPVRIEILEVEVREHGEMSPLAYHQKMGVQKKP